MVVTKIKKIPYWAYYNEEHIYVRVKRKRKLIDLYPQRALLEEARKQSSLIQANDWIDHNYYEDQLEQFEERTAIIIEKHSPKAPPMKKPEATRTHKVPQIDEPIFRRIKTD